MSPDTPRMVDLFCAARNDTHEAASRSAAVLRVVFLTVAVRFGAEVTGRHNRSSDVWRLTAVNGDQEMCPSYPSKLIVPMIIDDETLLRAAKFRSKGMMLAGDC